MSRLRDVQMHATVYDPDASGGPGLPKMELDPDMLNVVWQRTLNGASQAAVTLTRFNPKLDLINYLQDHIKIWRESASGTKIVFAGKIIKPSESTADAILYCWDYVAFLQRSRTAFRTLYQKKLIGTEIVSPEFDAAKAVATSPFAFVTKGTIEDPLGLDGVTPIKTNDQFGVIDFDRLFLFFSLAELSMANTANTVVFEITHDTPHTFNFWKNRTVQRTTWDLVYPGNLIDYDFDTGHDTIENDLATVILDSATGAQVEYVVSDATSITAYRRLQAAVAIRTLYGITDGVTESDQQKAALARMLTQAIKTSKTFKAFPRQGEIEPFQGWNLGDSFRCVLARPVAGFAIPRLDAYLRCIDVSASWSPAGGEVLALTMKP